MIKSDFERRVTAKMSLMNFQLKGDEGWRERREEMKREEWRGKREEREYRKEMLKLKS